MKSIIYSHGPCIRNYAHLFSVVGVIAIFSAPATYASAPVGRFIVTEHDDPNDNTVYDSVTKLTWQQKVLNSGRKWAEAVDYCDEQNTKKLGGFDSRWRLPTISELRTIVDTANIKGSTIDNKRPAIDPTAFPNARDCWFWSSTPYMDGNFKPDGTGGFAWRVLFSDGSSLFGKVDDIYTAVRCVRD
jgi:hypothetical protein